MNGEAREGKIGQDRYQLTGGKFLGDCYAKEMNDAGAF